MESSITSKKISDREKEKERRFLAKRGALITHGACGNGGRSADSRNQTAAETTSGTCVGERARSMRTAMISTGMKRRGRGGGGSGGRNRGRNSKERVRNTITATDLALNNLNIKLHCNRDRECECSSLDLTPAKDQGIASSSLHTPQQILAETNNNPHNRSNGGTQKKKQKKSIMEKKNEMGGGSTGVCI